MSKKIDSISNSRFRFDLLEKKDLEEIHAATLDVLENVGVRFPSVKALEILSSHGAHVDKETRIVRIPTSLIETALANAPAAYTLAARDANLDLELDGNHSYLGTDGCGVEIIDPTNLQRRRSTLKDIQDIARVCDSLDAIAFHWVPLSAQDCPPETRSLQELVAIWGASSKHVQTETIVTAKEMTAAIEMGALLMGGREQLRKRPILSIMQCTISPLAHDGGSLDTALAAAEAGLPVGFMTMASCAFSGPATLAGNLVVGNAEVISALALLQMAFPGCPVFYAAAQTAMDLRTGAYTGGGPEDFLFGAASNLIADYYNIPLSMGAYATGAPEPNWQAAVDNSLSAFMAVANQADMLLGAGLLNGSRIFSYEQLLLDCEIWNILCSMGNGIPVNRETLALDAIREVGPNGNFITHRHTLKNMGQLWRPQFMDRRPYTVWEEKHDGPRQWALEKARKILDSYQPHTLDFQLESELQSIIRRAA